MSELTILPVAIPLLVAAVLMGAQPVLPRRVLDAVGILTAATVLVLCVVLGWGALENPIITWAGGWLPRSGVALGVAFAIDPLGAGLASLAAFLMTASLVFSWRYFKASGALYHSLMLVFLAGMVGFCLTGDLFNLFVFFELMSVAAYALTGFKIEEEKSLEGALNFAVVNSIGAFLILIGIALLYGRTGALNLAQIGRELAGGPTDGLVVVSFVLIASGLCVKAALVPFHFWLADAHAVAPTPVCVIFSGVMVELGVYGVARVYWTIYANPKGLQPAAVGAIFIAAGTASALIGAVMCAAQRHIKRLLAFSTISHMGILLIALGLMTPEALAGGAVYVMGHGLVKGALFLVAGVLLHRAGTVDEFELRGLGRSLPVTGIAFVLAGLGLAGLPPFGTALGKSLIEGSARHSGRDWISLVLIATSAMTAGAVLRVAGRVFLGWGPPRGDREGVQGKDDRESRQGGGRIPWVMLGPIIVLVLSALISGLHPRLADGAIAAAGRFTNTAVYRLTVLDAEASGMSALASTSSNTEGLIGGLFTAACSVAIALSSLFADRFPRSLRDIISQAIHPAMGALRALHSGKVGDYVTWLTLGVAVFGIVLAILTGIKLS